MITNFPDLMRFKSLDEVECFMQLREYVDLLLKNEPEITTEFKLIVDEIIKLTYIVDEAKLRATTEFVEIQTRPLKDAYTEWDKKMKTQFDKKADEAKFKLHPEIKNSNRQILINHVLQQFQDAKNMVIDIVEARKA